MDDSSDDSWQCVEAADIEMLPGDDGAAVSTSWPGHDVMPAPHEASPADDDEERWNHIREDGDDPFPAPDLPNASPIAETEEEREEERETARHVALALGCDDVSAGIGVRVALAAELDAVPGLAPGSVLQESPADATDNAMRPITVDTSPPPDALEANSAVDVSLDVGDQLRRLEAAGRRIPGTVLFTVECSVHGRPAWVVGSQVAWYALRLLHFENASQAVRSVKVGEYLSREELEVAAARLASKHDSSSPDADGKAPPPRAALSLDLSSQQVEESELAAGDHVYTHRSGGAYAHHGIYCGHGEVVHLLGPGVAGLCSGGHLSASCGSMVVRTSLAEFHSGAPVHRAQYACSLLESVYHRGFMYKAAGSEPGEVLQRAQSRQGSTEEWHVLSNNCEHLAYFCKTGLALDNSPLTGAGQAGSTLRLLATGVAAARLLPLIPIAAAGAAVYHGWRYVQQQSPRMIGDAASPNAAATAPEALAAGAAPGTARDRHAEQEEQRRQRMRHE